MTADLWVPPARDTELVGWHGHARLEKYWADDDLTRATPYEVVEAENLMLTAGATLVLNRLAGISATAIDGTNGRMCVGDGTTAVSAGQTDLQGSNKFRKVFDAVPTVSGNQLQCVTTYLTSEANFAWNEAGIANSASGATLVNRFLQSFGTKSNSLQWILTITVTLS